MLNTNLVFTASALTDATGLNKNDALSMTNSLYANGLKCSCSQKYAYVKSSGETVEVQLNETATKNSNSACVYGSGANQVEVSCAQSSGSVLLKKYTDADPEFFNYTGETADGFVLKASQYAGYVQQGLSTKTQKKGFGNVKTEDLGDGMFKKAMFDFNNNAHVVYSFLIGFAFITSMLVFILIFMRITWLPDHPIKRREAMEDIITSGVAVILTGGIWIVISLFQSIFDRFWSSYAVYSKDWKTVANMFLYEYKGLVVGILGIAALTALLMLIKNFIALSFSGDNPGARKQKVTSILFCGLATAGLGGLAIFVSFFWNALNF